HEDHGENRGAAEDVEREQAPTVGAGGGCFRNRGRCGGGHDDVQYTTGAQRDLYPERIPGVSRRLDTPYKAAVGCTKFRIRELDQRDTLWRRKRSMWVSSARSSWVRPIRTPT